MFFLYLLLHRLEHRLPAAVQIGHIEYIIFDEEGAKIVPLATKDMRLAKCWALTDSNANVAQPCENFQALAQVAIQVSSPKPEQWKEWIKQIAGTRVVSELPTVLEIAAILYISVPVYLITSLTRVSAAKSSVSTHRLRSLSSTSGVPVLGLSSPLRSSQRPPNKNSQQLQTNQQRIYVLNLVPSRHWGRECQTVVPAFCSSALTALMVSLTSIRRPSAHFSSPRSTSTASFISIALSCQTKNLSNSSNTSAHTH